MRRRALLAALGSAALAGCGSSDGYRPPTSTTTTTSRPTTIAVERTPLPEPPADPDADAATSFVAAHEEAYVRGELLGHATGETGPVTASRPVDGVTDLTVEDARTAVVAEPEDAFYVVSSCSGRARYRSDGGMGVNAHFVTHYVGDGEHVRLPYNFYRCDVRDEPYRAADPAANVDLPEDGLGAKFQVYDFGSEKRTVDVTVSYLEDDRADAEAVLSETYDTRPARLVVEANVAVRRGEYRIRVEHGSRSATHRFTLAGPDDPSWDGTCVYLAPDGRIRVVEVATTGELAVPTSLCEMHAERGDAGD